MHAASVETAENRPAIHALQVDAPGNGPVFVIDPAVHSVQSLWFVLPFSLWYVPAVHLVHAASVETAEYCPATHALQVDAPGNGPVFVIDPAVHSVHAASAELAEYCPASHALQVDAPGDCPVLVMDPAVQV